MYTVEVLQAVHWTAESPRDVRAVNSAGVTLMRTSWNLRVPRTRRSGSPVIAQRAEPDLARRTNSRLREWDPE